MTLGPHFQHRRMVLAGHLAAGPGPQRRDRRGQGIVRVVLIGIASLQQPHPGRQLRLHVQDPLTGGDELLGQQVAQPGSAFDRPGPLWPRRRPLRELPGLRSRGADPDLAQRLFCRADHHRCVRALVRVHADHHCHHQYPPVRHHQERRTWRACLITDLLSLAPLLSHATARPGRLAPRYKARPGQYRHGRQAVREPARQTSRTLRHNPKRPQEQLGGYLRGHTKSRVTLRPDLGRPSS